MAYGWSDNIDYTAAIAEALKNGDKATAALLEQGRNAKIQGEGLTQYEPTNDYGQYLPGGTGDGNNGGGASQQDIINYTESQDAKNTTLPSYSSSYGSDISSILNQIKNYGTYNPSTDTTLQDRIAAYTKQYTGLGQTAMQDTVGQISARTGGLASSYAGSAGQQAYNNYMAALDAKKSDLTAQGKQDWQNERTNLYNLLSATQGVDNTDYSRYRDTVGDSEWQQQFAATQKQNDISNNQWQQQFGADQAQQAYLNKFNETQYADSRTDANFNKTQALLSMGFSTQQIADTLGIPIEQANNYAALQQQILKKQGTIAKTGGSGGSSAGKPKLTAAQVQAAIKAGTLTSDVLSAYEYYYGAPYGGTGNENASTEDLYAAMSADADPATYFIKHAKEYGFSASDVNTVMSGYKKWSAAQTPESFSDGAKYTQAKFTLDLAQKLLNDGKTPSDVDKWLQGMIGKDITQDEYDYILNNLMVGG